MKRILILILILTSSIGSMNLKGQGIYSTSSGEVILSGADIRFNNVDVNTLMRFTIFFHLQYNWNFDFTDFLGIYTGVGIRNVGLIMEDYFQNVGFINVDNTHENYNKNTKVKKRSFSIGIPIALKLGSFGDNFYLYGGGEYEYMFLYKQKLFIDDNKTKFHEWGSKRVNPWQPSFFVGVQFPYGINLKFKYYLTDFLNKDFRGTDFGYAVDYSQFQKSQIWYISLCYTVNNKDIKKMYKNESRTAMNSYY